MEYSVCHICKGSGILIPIKSTKKDCKDCSKCPGCNGTGLLMIDEK